MKLSLTDSAKAYIQQKGMDVITISHTVRRGCCTTDYSAWISLGPPKKNHGFQMIDVDGITVYVSGFITGLEKERELTVRLMDLKLKKMLILDKNQ